MAKPAKPCMSLSKNGTTDQSMQGPFYSKMENAMIWHQNQQILLEHFYHWEALNYCLDWLINHLVQKRFSSNSYFQPTLRFIPISQKCKTMLILWAVTSYLGVPHYPIFETVSSFSLGWLIDYSANHCTSKLLFACLSMDLSLWVYPLLKRQHFGGKKMFCQYVNHKRSPI